MRAPPAGFRAWRSAGRDLGTIAVLDAAIHDAALARGLGEPWTLIERGATTGLLSGRGAAGRVVLADGRELWLKQYLRGGYFGRANPERYFATGRFFDELVVARQAHAAGLPIVLPLGFVLRRARPGWRAWGITTYVPDATRLAQWVGRPEFDELWQEALQLLETLLERGLEHRDFNLGNLLIQAHATAPGSAARRWWVIDLDRARWHARPVPEQAAAAVRARFLHSRRKCEGLTLHD